MPLRPASCILHYVLGAVPFQGGSRLALPISLVVGDWVRVCDYYGPNLEWSVLSLVPLLVGRRLIWHNSWVIGTWRDPIS